MKTGVAYHDVRDLRHVREDLRDMVDHHCTFVVHTFSESDLAFYTRTMKDIVAASKDAGLEVYIDPWAVGGIFGGEAFSRFVAENLADRQVLADGTSVPSACMNSPKFRSFMKIWIETAADIGSDIAFWDEPHFHMVDWYEEGAGPLQWACCCPTCRKLFEEKCGRPLPADMDADVVAFREETVVGFFSELCDHAKRCGLKNALCVLPEEDPRRGVSNWNALAQLPSLDIFGTDPYWAVRGLPLEPYVRDSARKARGLCEKYGLELQMWVLAFMIEEGREDEVMRAAEIFYEEGVRNIAAWSYGGGGWMYTRSENADKVWENLGKVFAKLHRGAGA
jgi:hypothetical protein